MNNTDDYQLTTNYMWFKMILKTFENQTSKNDAFSYFISQFKIIKDNLNDTYFYTQCKEHATALKQAFEVILANKCQLPNITTDIIEQVYKCEFVFDYDKNSEFGIFEEKILLIEVKDFDNILKALERLITDCKYADVSDVDSVDSKQSTNYSLMLRDYNKKHNSLLDLKNSLIDKGFISKDTKLGVFKKIFSGKEISTRVVWIATPTDLGYFIKQLNNLELIKDMKQDHWIAVVNCFVDKNGNSFKRETLHASKTPAKKKKIDSVLKTLI
jgi:hypothetical protein